MIEQFRRLGIEVPIFAFSHCRDVVVAVSKAGGMGVYGASLHSDAQIEIDLRWIEQQLGDKPYGIDLMMPGKDGFDTVVAMQQLTPKAKIIAMSGVWYGKADHAAMAKSLGLVAVIEKPFDRPQLLELVATTLMPPVKRKPKSKPKPKPKSKKPKSKKKAKPKKAKRKSAKAKSKSKAKPKRR